jgi:hypothetical protein
MTDIIVNDELTVNAESFANDYASHVIAEGFTVADEYAKSVLGNDPDQKVIEELRPFVEGALQAHKETIAAQLMSAIQKAESEDGSTGDTSVESVEGMASREGSGEDVSEASEEAQEATNTTTPDSAENA